MTNVVRSLCLIFGLTLYVIPALAGAVRSFPGVSMSSLNKGDEESSGAVPLGFSINLFGKARSSVYVNTNGNITFDGPFDGYPGMPATDPDTGVMPNIVEGSREVVAPFFADIDTSDPDIGSITYGPVTVNGHAAFAVTFADVGYYRFYTNGLSDKHNTFQVILIDRSDKGPGNFDIEFNYDKIDWETSESSGGSDGIGGASAQVAYSAGIKLAGAFFELLGSHVPGSFLTGGPQSLLTGSANSGGVAGRYVFNIQTTPPLATISSLSPSSAQPGSPAFTLSVSGSGFTAGSTVQWNGSNLPTTFVSGTQLTASVAANLIASQGTATVVASTNGLSSNSVSFAVAALPAPTVSSLNPSTIQAGSPAFTLSVSGSGFTAGSMVQWSGSNLPTTFVSATQLTASVTANLIASQGTATVTVNTGSATSNGFGFTISAPAQTSDCLTCGLVGYWNFDETFGSVAADSSGNNNNGPVAEPTWTPGKVNNGLYFDSHTEVIVPNSPSLNPTSEMTIALWIKADNWSGNRRIVQKGDDGDLQYRLLVEYGQFKFDSQCNGCGVSTLNVPTVGVWHFVAGTINATSAILYIDGQPVATGVGSGVLHTTPAGLNIGTKNQYGSADDHFLGMMDELRIYNRALTAQEISSLMGSTSPAMPRSLKSAVNPSVGQEQIFSSSYTDSYGYADISWVEIHFQTQLVATNACYIQYVRATNMVYLVSDSGTAYAGAGQLGTSGTLSNNQCTIDTGASSVLASGNSLTLNLAVTLKPVFARPPQMSTRSISNAAIFSQWNTLNLAAQSHE